MTISVRGLVVSDGRRDVVAGVDLDVEPGAVTAVIGANGAGKSELVLALAGVLPVKAGSILLDGAPLPERARGDPAGGHRGHSRRPPRADAAIGRGKPARRGNPLARWAGRTAGGPWAIFPELPNARGSWRALCPAGSSRWWRWPMP